MKHEINAQDLIDWRLDQEITFARSVGNKSNKELKCDFSGYCQVYDHGVLVLETTNEAEAVEKYNSLR